MIFRSQNRNLAPRRGFTLVELLTVISILCLLAAILQPVFFEVKRNALKTPCQSNLRQIGSGIHLYAADWDDRYPWAIDAYTRANGEALSDFPEPTSEIPDMVKVLSAYTGGHGEVWHCSTDRGPYDAPILGQPNTKQYPSAFAFAGSSYLFSLEIAYFGKPHTSLNETELRVSSDAGIWHCGYQKPDFFTKAKNVLFGDGHVHFASDGDRS